MAANQSSGDAAVIADLAVKAQGQPFFHALQDGRLFALLPGAGEHGGYALQDVSDPHREAPKPHHISQQVTLQTLDSLVDYVKTFRTETTATVKRGAVEIPSRFMLQIPVYFGEQSVSVPAFLRWRLVEGEGLKLGVRLHNPEHIRQAVFKQVVLAAADRSERPALFGYLG